MVGQLTAFQRIHFGVVHHQGNQTILIGFLFSLIDYKSTVYLIDYMNGKLIIVSINGCVMKVM